MATLTCPACAAEVQQDNLICFTCGADLPRRKTADEPASPTIMQESPNVRARRPRPPGRPARTAARPSWSLRPCSAPYAVSRCRPGRESSRPSCCASIFPTGNVEVPAGTSLVLGRDPEESLVAAAFASYDNVSRRHATVTVSDTGQATIRDEHSTNGTFVNGDPVSPASRSAWSTGTASGWPRT